MTSSAESGSRPEGEGEHPTDLRGREAALGAQARALPSGQVTVSCSAARGNGGLGRHLDEIAAALEAKGSPAVLSGDELGGRAGSRGGLAGLLAALPVPVSPGVRARSFMLDYDRRAAERLPAGDHLIAFNSQALAQMEAAAAAGYETRRLVSANSHINRLVRRHALAHRRYPLEGSWAAHLVRRNLAEYARADTVYYASDYIRESFLQEGYPAERLQRFPLTPDPRYTPGRREPRGETFEIVYVGSLVVHKGVPLLIDAVRRLPHSDLRLTLVGGWASRGMRRFVQGAIAADPRIAARPGDPLPHLRSAAVCVHPAYEDGFAYAPAEALACGVPVIVSEDTGMKELIGSDAAGVVVPTDDPQALSEAIEAAYRGELFGG